MVMHPPCALSVRNACRVNIQDGPILTTVSKLAEGLYSRPLQNVRTLLEPQAVQSCQYITFCLLGFDTNRSFLLTPITPN
jgi:hypothetical protein